MPPAMQLEDFSDLVHQIYAASAEPRRWSNTVGAVAKALGAIQAVLFTPYAGPGQGGVMFPWQVKEQDLVLYGTKYIHCDLWAQSAQQKGFIKDGVVALDQDLVPHDELLASIYYRDFLSTMGVGRICSGVVFGGAPGLPATVLSLYRSPDDPFGQQERESLRLLLPHLSRSLGLMHRLNQARCQLDSLHAALNRLSMGVFLLDQALEVTYANTAAQQVLDRADGLSLDGQRRLTAPGHVRSGNVRLEAWLAAAVALPEHERKAFTSTFEVSRRATPKCYSVQCCTFEPNDPFSLNEGARHIVFVTDPKLVELPGPIDLQMLLGLTPAEARVTHALVQGGSYRDVANSLGISEETVRTHIRSVYAKTQSTDKAGLTRMVYSLSKATV